MGSRRESWYRDRLAEAVLGRKEVSIPLAGRADVATKTDVFEVEAIATWRHGLRQVVSYSVFSGLRGNLALFGEIPADIGDRIYRLLHKNRAGVRLWFYDATVGWMLIDGRRMARRHWSLKHQDEFTAEQLEIIRRVQNHGWEDYAA